MTRSGVGGGGLSEACQRGHSSAIRQTRSTRSQLRKGGRRAGRAHPGVAGLMRVAAVSLPAAGQVPLGGGLVDEDDRGRLYVLASDGLLRTSDAKAVEAAAR